MCPRLLSRFWIIKHCEEQMQWDDNRAIKNLKRVLPAACGSLHSPLGSRSVEALVQQWTVSVQA